MSARRLKHLVGYPLWDCVDMIPWLLDGIRNLDPSRIEIVLLLSNVPQETKDNLSKNLPMLSGYSHTTFSTDKDLREGANHNLLLEYFLQTDCDTLIACQDDNRFMTGKILDDLDWTVDHYRDAAGVIGFRDGYDFMHHNIIGSGWSKSDIRKETLPVGQSIVRTMVNTGPIVYTRHTAQTVGLNDDFPVFAFEDYCLRCCFKHDKHNIVLGTLMEHDKMGRRREADYGSPLVPQDLARLNDKWWPVINQPVHG